MMHISLAMFGAGVVGVDVCAIVEGYYCKEAKG